MKTPENILARNRKYYWKNREKVLAQHKERYPEVREKVLAQQKEPARVEQRRVREKTWRAAHKDKVRSKNLSAKYRINLAEWNQRFEAQGRCCAICETTEPIGLGWQTDHIHGTDIIRGILCVRCNISLHNGDTPELLRKKADYLEKNGH